MKVPRRYLPPKLANTSLQNWLKFSCTYPDAVRGQELLLNLSGAGHKDLEKEIKYRPSKLQGMYLPGKVAKVLGYLA